jgi:nitrite reductase/ring-hydroxylating ferredoxin subunit
VSARARHLVCTKAELPPGTRIVREVAGRSIGVFNVDGTYYALHNRCPHKGGALCEGPLTGTTLPTDGFEYPYGLEGRIVRCAWHGWEFEVESGRCLVDARVRARSFPVEVEGDMVFVVLPVRERTAAG